MANERYTDSPALITPSDLVSSLPTAFEKGLASGELLFFESTTTPHHENGIDFEIRRCPALLHKPTLPTPHFQDSSPPQSEKWGSGDPFAPPYLTGLCLGRMNGEDDSEYVIMLNKFSVVKHHFLLITKNFQSQTTPPTPPDLVLAYQILLAGQKARKPFLAFFNCGDRSGASQPHKHLQFIPLDEGGAPFEDATGRHNVDNELTPFSLPNLPYAHYIRRLPPTLASAPVDTLYDALGNAFMSLLDLAITAIRNDPDEHPRGPPSYNVLLTPGHLTVIPRSREKYLLAKPSMVSKLQTALSSLSVEPSKVSVAGDTSPSPTMSINSLGFAGMFLVKSEEEAEAVFKEGIVNMLRGVGVPKMVDDSLAEPQSKDDTA